jgi:flagellar FliJ protein
MAKFQFRFESLLKHRRLLEDQRQRDLAKHVRMRMICHDELRKMQQTLRDSKHELSSSLLGRIDLSAVSQFARYSGHVNQRAHQIIHRLAQVEKQIIDAREKLLDATRQRKALELLRTKHHDQWKRDQQRRETAQMDEAATQRHVRRQAMEQVW